MLRTFLSSYFLPNCRRKNPKMSANAVIETDAVVPLAHAATGRSRVLKLAFGPGWKFGTNGKTSQISVVAVSRVLQPDSRRSQARALQAPTRAAEGPLRPEADGTQLCGFTGAFSRRPC